MGNVTTDQQLAALRQQLAQAQARVQGGMTAQGARNDVGSTPGMGARGGSEISAGTADMNRINQQIAALGGFGSPNAGGGSQDPLSELLGNARGRVSDLTGDPVDAMIRQRLQDVMGGKIAPYDDTTKNALFTSQADQAGAGEAARNQQIMDQVAMNGGSANDPSARAALNESMLQRQLANQGAHLNVDMNANTANFNAAQQATGALASDNNAHQAQITQASQYLGSQLGNVTHQLPSMIPNFQQFQSGFSGGVSPSTGGYSPTSGSGGLYAPPADYRPATSGSTSTYSSDPSNYSNEGPWSAGYNQTQNPTTQNSQSYRDQQAPAPQQPQWSDEPDKWTGGVAAPASNSFTFNPLPQGMGQKPKTIKPINPWAQE